MQFPVQQMTTMSSNDEIFFLLNTSSLSLFPDQNRSDVDNIGSVVACFDIMIAFMQE